MIEIFLSILLYTIFGFAGIFASKKIKFIQKNFYRKQNLIYLSIFYIVYGFFLGQLDTGNLGIAYQIGFGLGNFLSALAGAIIATYGTNLDRCRIDLVSQNKYGRRGLRRTYFPFVFRTNGSDQLQMLTTLIQVGVVHIAQWFTQRVVNCLYYFLTVGHLLYVVRIIFLEEKLKITRFDLGVIRSINELVPDLRQHRWVRRFDRF